MRTNIHPYHVLSNKMLSCAGIGACADANNL